jgi:membrane fusion protein, hemolysin D
MTAIPSNVERKVIPFRRRWAERPRREEREFLPAALEIIETPVSIAGRGMMGLLVVLVAVAVIWSCIGELDVVATATGRIIPSGQIKLIQPLEIGVVKTIKVANGDHVRAGDILIEIDTTTNEADRDKIARDFMQAEVDIARLQAALAGSVEAFAPPQVEPGLIEAARRQLSAQLNQLRAKLEGFDGQIAGKTADREQTKAVIAKLDASLPLLRQKAEIYDSLRENNFTSKIAVIDAKRQLVEAIHDRIASTHQVESAEAQIATLTQQRNEAEADFHRQTLDDLRKTSQYAAEQRQDLIKAAQRTGLQTLRAPVDGTVEQLSIHTVGGVVTPAQSLMVIVPEGSTLEVEAMLPNRDAGFVHAGQPAELKIEAFTYTRYGLLHGTVRHVSRDVMRNERDASSPDRDQASGKSSPKDAAASSAPADSAYMAQISLAETEVETEEGPIPLEPGMSVTAEIKTGQRRIIEYLLSPFLRYRHDTLRER